MKTYPKMPKSEDLITPLYRKRSYFVYFSPFQVTFDLESGDYEIDYNFSKKKPTKWQLLVLRFKIWRMRRKIRKALKNK